MPADSGAQEASELAALRKEARSNILRALALMHESNEKKEWIPLLVMKHASKIYPGGALHSRT